MARTPLMQLLEQAAAGAAEEHSSPGTTRREFMWRAGAAGALVTVGSAARWLPAANAATAPRIVVVGAGLAGLTCGYRLKQAGYSAQIHEANPGRIGGRCWTRRSDFDGGQIAEHGGEMIDSGHLQMKHLAQELGLKLDNLIQAQPNGTEDFYRFFGQPYTFEQATNDIKEIWQQVHSDVSAASYPTQYNLFTERGFELDQMSIAEWIDTYVPGGHGSPLGQLLDVAYNIEYGAETDAQSSLNMLYLLGYAGQGQLRVFGKSNEKLHVRGGNDQVTQRLGAALQGQIVSGSELIAIRVNSDGTTYTLTFQQGLSTTQVVADQVVLALPFSVLRSSVDFSGAGFNQLKTIAINELGMGTNSKLHLQFTNRHWNQIGCNGNTYADTGYQSTWDVTRAQPGQRGILVDYTGGTIGASFGSGTPSGRAKKFLAQIEPVLPGLTARWNGRATVDFWTADPWTMGSYSYWKVGQYTRFGGAEGERSGNCSFAGEHTSVDFQGYLNGGVETGERAAAEILSDLK